MKKLPPDRGRVSTEQRHPASPELDLLDSLGCVQLLANDVAGATRAVHDAAPAIAAFVDDLVPRFEHGGRLVYAGAGTSGRLGVLDASECPPTFQSDPGRIVGVIAGGDAALRRSSERREDDPEGIQPDLAALDFHARDTLLGIAAGGTTPYVLGAIVRARAHGAMTGLLTCAAGPAIPSCDHRIELRTGAEILTGSTRLKAGTATKIALNAITTTLFVRLGKVYGNLMVDLAVTNDKLLDRAIRILQQFDPALSRESAAALLESAGNSLKCAIVMSRLGATRVEAESKLAAAHGRLRAVIG